MARQPPTERLRFTARSMLIAVGMLGVTLAGLRLFASATRVIGWIVTAIVIAALLYPLVLALTRWMPRAVAVLLVLVVVVGGTSFVAYQLVDTLVREMHALQASAPRAAADLEQSKRYGELARKMHLADRTAEFVHTIPQRLQGGSPSEAFRSAATRGVAFLATGVLSLFFLLHGPRMMAGGVRQIRDPVRRERVGSVGGRAYQRAWVYLAGTICIALVAGLVAYLTGRMAGVPGALPLAVWVALWDVVPLLGVFIGALPIVLLAATLGSTGKGIAVAAVLLAYNVVEVLVLQRFVESRSLRVGPFLTIVGGLVGVELYGIGGALLAVAWLTLVAAVLSELLPSSSSSGPDGGSAEEQPRPPEVGDLVQRGERAHATP